MLVYAPFSIIAMVIQMDASLLETASHLSFCVEFYFKLERFLVVHNGSRCLLRFRRKKSVNFINAFCLTR